MGYCALGNRGSIARSAQTGQQLVSTQEEKPGQGLTPLPVLAHLDCKNSLEAI